jgi:hypothetical protein
VVPAAVLMGLLLPEAVTIVFVAGLAGLSFLEQVDTVPATALVGLFVIEGSGCGTSDCLNESFVGWVDKCSAHCRFGECALARGGAHDHLVGLFGHCCLAADAIQSYSCIGYWSSPDAGDADTAIGINWYCEVYPKDNQIWSKNLVNVTISLSDTYHIYPICTLFLIITHYFTQCITHPFLLTG